MTRAVWVWYVRGCVCLDQRGGDRKMVLIKKQYTFSSKGRKLPAPPTGTLVICLSRHLKYPNFPPEINKVLKKKFSNRPSHHHGHPICSPSRLFLHDRHVMCSSSRLSSPQAPDVFSSHLSVSSPQAPIIYSPSRLSDSSQAGRHMHAQSSLLQRAPRRKA